MNVPWDAATAHAIGADWLEAAIAPSAELGRRARRAERAFVPGDEEAARAAIAAVARAARELAPELVETLRSSIAAAPDPALSVARAGAGDVLADTEFFELQRFLDAVVAVRAAAQHAGEAIVALPEPLDDLAAALEPGRTAARSFYLADDFDANLAQVRGEAASARAAFDSARSALEARAAGALGLDHLREGEFIVMREKVPGGLPEGIRVVREAPTYFLCELALDERALDAFRAFEAASELVAEREETVRARLSGLVRSAGARLGRAGAVLGNLDSFLARVRFAQRFAGCEPQIGESGSAFAFEAGRYLALEALLADKGRRYEPISLALERVAVVTGPNMGGKTAALRTCGFLAACAALGVPLPAEHAALPLFGAISWIGLSRAVEETSLLSSFGTELVEVRELLESPAGPVLALVDEFARTTSPREGRALLVALLEALDERGAHAFAATHLTGIAEAAGVAHYAIAGLRDVPRANATRLPLEAALGLISQIMDHRLRPAAGTPENSDALALAEMLGLDAAFVARTRRLLSSNSELAHGGETTVT